MQGPAACMGVPAAGAAQSTGAALAIPCTQPARCSLHALLQGARWHAPRGAGGHAAGDCGGADPQRNRGWRLLGGAAAEQPFLQASASGRPARPSKCACCYAVRQARQHLHHHQLLRGLGFCRRLLTHRHAGPDPLPQHCRHRASPVVRADVWLYLTLPQAPPAACHASPLCCWMHRRNDARS